MKSFQHLIFLSLIICASFPLFAQKVTYEGETFYL